MEYKQIHTEIVDRVGVITLDNPPRNAFSKRMMVEVLDILDQWENNDTVRTVFMKSTGPNFSAGADAGDIDRYLTGKPEEFEGTLSEWGGKLVERIDSYPKSTIVAARGYCVGGSTAIFNSFDIRIVGEHFNIHDGDIYYGTVGSWGMSSLRLPIWIGRNKMMDYMLLNEDFSGQQAYELGIASKVVADELVDEIGMFYAKKMSIAAPVAVKYFKEIVRAMTAPEMEKLRKIELELSAKVFETEDCKRGLAAVIKGEQAEFTGK